MTGPTAPAQPPTIRLYLDGLPLTGPDPASPDGDGPPPAAEERTARRIASLLAAEILRPDRVPGNDRGGHDSAHATRRADRCGRDPDPAASDSVRVDVRAFSSGAVSADIRYRQCFVVLDGTRDGEWGVSGAVDTGEDSGGYDEVYDSLTGAVAAVARILGTPASAGAGEVAGDHPDA
jgi:hypothetical protein